MGKLTKRFRAERRADRIADPHRWADEIESREGGRAIIMLVLIGVVIGLGWQVWEMRKELAEYRERLAEAEYVIVP